MQFLDVIARQAHPGPDVPAYTSMAQKVHDAYAYQQREQIPYPVLVDDIEGRAHQVYGGLSDPIYLIDIEGRVSFYNMWAHAPTLHQAIEQLLEQGGVGVVRGAVDKKVHLGAPLTGGWRGIQRGLWQSVVDMETSLPGSSALLLGGYLLKPVLAPITQRAEPLPRQAKAALWMGGGLLALAAYQTATRWTAARRKGATSLETA